MSEDNLKREKKTLKLYRYISFEDFSRMLILNQDRYANTNTWLDKSEGYIFKLISESEETRKRLLGELFKMSGEDVHTTISHFIKMYHSKCFAYGQCWTMGEESELMWRANAYGNKALRIESNNRKVIDILNKQNETNFQIEEHSICYDLNTEESFLTNYFNTDAKRDVFFEIEPYFHKKAEYSNEMEYRFLLVDNTTVGLDALFGNGTIRSIENEIKAKKEAFSLIDAMHESIRKNVWEWEKIDIPKSRMVDLPKELNKYILSVTVHPSAEDWYVDYISELCLKHNIKFEGKSKLYESIL